MQDGKALSRNSAGKKSMLKVQDVISRYDHEPRRNATPSQSCAAGRALFIWRGVAVAARSNWHGSAPNPHFPSPNPNPALPPTPAPVRPQGPGGHRTMSSMSKKKSLQILGADPYLETNCWLGLAPSEGECLLFALGRHAIDGLTSPAPLTRNGPLSQANRHPLPIFHPRSSLAHVFTTGSPGVPASHTSRFCSTWTSRVSL